jgi:hypothetical protein
MNDQSLKLDGFIAKHRHDTVKLFRDLAGHPENEYRLILGCFSTLILSEITRRALLEEIEICKLERLV